MPPSNILRSVMRCPLLLFALLLLTPPPTSAQKAPGQSGTFALTNARLVTVTHGTVEQGTLVIRDGRIAALGANVPVPDDAEVIDCTDRSVYPGLIDAGTQLGLVEVSSLSETRDFREIGTLTPHMQALTAVNPNSVSIPVTRVNGVTSVLTVPSGGLLPGTAALINLHGYTPAQMHLGGFEAVVLDFPSTTRRGSWDDRSPEKIEKQAQEIIDKLNEVWDRATLYARIDSAHAARPEENHRPAYSPAMQALVPVVRDSMPLIVKADGAADITAALEWARKHGVLDQMILSGAAEGWRVADEIAAAEIPVLAGPVLATPSRDADRYDKAYVNPGLMQQAGVQVALRTGEAENVRNLPYHAGFAAAYGMGRTEALRAVTIVPAEIFGVDEEVGSLDVGKRANLFVATGDPFQTQTDIVHLFIDGFRIPLESRHTKLYDEFLHRNPGLTK